jgi:uncharacterized protein YdeI (YjbR/CyaY-like superfamily)
VDRELSPSPRDRPPEPRFFATPQALRRWFEAHHATDPELLVGFYKVGSGVPSITWPESVDQALCFGWIDGIRRGIDEVSYTNRFTPRKPGSTWSGKNIARVAELTEMGMMHPTGMAAFERRIEARSGVYSFEQERIELGPAFERRFRADRAAWAFFRGQPPSYRKAATWWVINAKKEETRARRLETLMDDSANGRRIKQLTRPSGEGSPRPS